VERLAFASLFSFDVANIKVLLVTTIKKLKENSMINYY
jgi:hypothetical protein